MKANDYVKGVAIKMKLTMKERDVDKKDVHGRKIEGTMTDVYVDPEFLELLGYNDHKR